MPTPLNTGKKAPAFSLPFDDGTKKALKDFKGNKLVIFFYPKDSTPGCTTEAKEFSAAQKAFEAVGCEIIGISKDSLERHLKFREKNDLTIPLGSDEDGAVLDKFGVWKEKKNFGKTYMGIERSTFLLDEEGRILQIWRKVRVAGHVAHVLNAVKSA